VLALVEHFCANSRLRIEEAFQGVARNTDRMGYRLAQSILADSSAFLREGIVHKDFEARLAQAVAAEEKAEKVPELARTSS
jgi:hypothetical protein